MAIEVGDVIKATARLAWDGLSDIMNTWHVHMVDTLTNTQGQIISDIALFIDTIYSEWVGSVPTNTDFVDINLYNETKEEPYGSFDWPTLTSGQGVGDPYAPGVAVFAWLPTTVSECFGRKWIGPFQESNFTAGVAISGLTNLVSAGLDLCMDNFIAAFGSDTEMAYVVKHQFEDGSELFPPQYIPPYSYNVAGNAGYQRRRRPGVGS